MPTETDYVGPFVYEGDILQFFPTPEGRTVKTASGYDHQFMLKDHLGNVRALYGRPFEGGNLLPNSDCRTLDYFVNAQNVTRTLEKIDDETYIKFVANQTTSTPGTITGYIDVQAGEKYTFKAKGYRTNNPTSPAYLYVWTNAGDLVWPGANLPYGRESENWVFNDFTIPEGVTQIRLGIFWREGEGLAIGDAFYLNEAALFKHQDEDYSAGFEVVYQGQEASQFSNYHTDKISNMEVYAVTGSSAYLLTGSTQTSNNVIGPTKSLRVYPGDAIHMEVYGRYFGSTGGGTDVGAVLAGALQNAFGLAAGGATDMAYQSIGDLFGEGALIGTAAYPYEDEVPPKAFLNYILFDDDYVPYDFGYDQIGTDAVISGSGNDKMSLIAKVTKPGYIYVYLSNENPVTQEVYFDDFAIKHVKGVAIQENDYYPFGLTFNSYQRENSIFQDYKYNGKEEQKELGLGWLDYGMRMYQPELGRFFTKDRFAEKYRPISPYQYAANNPVRFIDVNGDSIDIYDSAGKLVMTIDDGKKESTGIYFQKTRHKKDGSTVLSGGVSFAYNDEETDRASAKNGDMVFEVVSDSFIEGAMEKSGVNDWGNKAMGWGYLPWQSVLRGDGRGGKMDYFSFNNLEQDKIYIVKSKFGDAVGYNDSDFGNFLWGLGTRRLGFSVWTAQGGAHANNAVNGRDQNAWNPKYEHQILDSNADQQAIRNGYFYNRRPQENGIYTHDILKK